MQGSGNHFHGRRHTIESREKMSATKRALPYAFRGMKRPEYLTRSLMARIQGVPRDDNTKAKMSAHMLDRHRSFDYCVRKAECGRTAGKPGIFYVVRIGGELKFGSATTTMNYRLTRLRQKHGDVQLVTHCVVSDAGAHEASMMMEHRADWLHGEFFRDFTQGVSRAAA